MSASYGTASDMKSSNCGSLIDMFILNQLHCKLEDKPLVAFKACGKSKIAFRQPEN